MNFTYQNGIDPKAVLTTTAHLFLRLRAGAGAGAGRSWTPRAWPSWPGPSPPSGAGRRSSWRRSPRRAAGSWRLGLAGPWGGPLLGGCLGGGVCLTSLLRVHCMGRPFQYRVLIMTVGEGERSEGWEGWGWGLWGFWRRLGRVAGWVLFQAGLASWVCWKGEREVGGLAWFGEVLGGVKQCRGGGWRLEGNGMGKKGHSEAVLRRDGKIWQRSFPRGIFFFRRILLIAWRGSRGTGTSSNQFIPVPVLCSQLSFGGLGWAFPEDAFGVQNISNLIWANATLGACSSRVVSCHLDARFNLLDRQDCMPSDPKKPIFFLLGNNMNAKSRSSFDLGPVLPRRARGRAARGPAAGVLVALGGLHHTGAGHRPSKP